MLFICTHRTGMHQRRAARTPGARTANLAACLLPFTSHRRQSSSVAASACVRLWNGFSESISSHAAATLRCTQANSGSEGPAVVLMACNLFMLPLHEVIAEAHVSWCVALPLKQCTVVALRSCTSWCPFCGHLVKTINCAPQLTVATAISMRCCGLSWAQNESQRITLRQERRPSMWLPPCSLGRTDYWGFSIYMPLASIIHAIMGVVARYLTLRWLFHSLWGWGDHGCGTNVVVFNDSKALLGSFMASHRAVYAMHSRAKSCHCKSQFKASV